MQHIFVTNGIHQLILMPENELDKLLLESIVTGQVEVERITQQVSVLGKSVKDGVLIKRKSLESKVTKDDST